MERTKKLTFLKGTISLSLSVVLTKILGVAFKVPLSYVLGDEGMGYFNTAYAIYGVLYIFCTAGVPKSLLLVISEQRAREKQSEAEIDVLKCGLKLFFWIGAFATLLIIIGAKSISNAIGNRNAYYSIIAVAPSILFVSLGGVLRGYLNCKEKLSNIAISQLIEASLKLILGLVFSYIGMRMNASICVISALAISGISMGSLFSFLYMYKISKTKKEGYIIKQNDFLYSKSISRKIIKNALPIALSSFLLNLSGTIDLMIIINCLTESGMSNYQANAIYGNYSTLAVPMFNLVTSVLAPISLAYMPRLSELYMRSEKNEYIYVLRRLLFLTLLLVVPMSLSYYFYSFELLDILFSTQSSALGAELLITLSIGLCFLTSLTVVNTALEAQGKIGSAVFSLVIGGVVKSISSFLLIDKIGVLGAPLGTVLSYLISLSISLFILELVGIRTHAILKGVLLYLLGIVSFYPAYKYIYTTVSIGSSFVSMMFALIISFISYFVLVGVGYVIITKLRVSKMHKNYSA